MDIRVLRYFLAVAQEGNISQAAETLHMTQPTLSRQLIDLEADLGVQLFVRGKRKITLTDEGVLLQKRAEEITELVDKTERDIKHEQGVVAGVVSIGGGETHAMQTVARMACDIQRDYPHVKFDLYSGNADDVADKLDKGLIDFGIFIGPANVTKYESLSLPERDVWGVLMPRKSILAKSDAISPAQLFDLPLIGSRQTLVNKEMSEWFGRDFDKLNIVATYNLLYNASLLVQEGLGYALCLNNIINTEGSELVFRPLTPSLEAHLDIVWKRNQVFSRAAAVFMESIFARVEHAVVGEDNRNEDLKNTYKA
ncbi:MAG: LysR family transcriptional regulator [Raoultibacter sp.]